jgi:predicted ATPase
MSESDTGFESLPPEYRQVVRLSQEQHNIRITPLQELVGGWSGAAIYLVSVTSSESSRAEHLVLKLDQKRPMSSSDEISRHKMVQSKSPPSFVQQHIPEMAYERVESEEALAIFYTAAGHSLRKFRTLSSHRRQNQLEALFKATNHYLLDAWNTELNTEPVAHPQALLKRWLGFRLQPGQKIEQFLRDECRVNPESEGFIVHGDVFPNPLRYARERAPWGPARPGDAIVGLQHSDLNTNNILAKFSPQGDELEGYYLIDFALFKEKMPLLYDQRYLEMSFLVQAISQGSFAAVEALILQLGEHDILDSQQAPIEMAGVNGAIREGRVAFDTWVTENHPSLHDDLWGQYWLAGTAAGLSYCHKAGQAAEVRLAGLIYAAANLKRYLRLFDLAMPATASQLYHEGASAAEPGLVTPSGRAPNNLPAPPTSFIGRSSELSDVTEMLLREGTRLVTLTGPGGTGKTRLGLEICRGIVDRFTHGVTFIDLASVRDPDLLATTAAHTIGIREGGSRTPLENLKEYLAKREMLLLFDNFEQIIGAAPVVADLLAAAPGVRLLVTSRVTLQVRGEQEYPVASLGLPHKAGQTPAEILEFDAIALFRQQARAVQPHFEISAENGPVVVEICRRLDGLPLAIEIAAARIKMLPPRALLKRLQQSLKVLVSGARDLPDRQQTLHRTIDWSYQLLQPEERAVFARLGVFAGGFTLAAAEQVCNGAAGIDVFSTIETLLNSSLLRQVRSAGDTPRFDMLQTIRDYALEKVEASGEAEELHWAHCGYYAQLAGSELGPGIFGAQSVAALRRIDEEHDNFRSALSWAFQHEDGLLSAQAMLTPLGWFWYRYGHLREGREWSERAVAVTAGLGESPFHAGALSGLGYLALWAGDLLVATESAHKAVVLSERLGFEQGISQSKLCLGTALINQGRHNEAYPHLVDAVELFDQQQEPWAKGITLVHLANVSLGMGDSEQAVRWLDMAMPVIEESGDIWVLAFALNNYGEVARARGDYSRAEAYYRRTEALYEQADAQGDQARLVHTFGYIAQHGGDLEQAQRLFRQSLTQFRELGNHRGIAECLAGLAGLAAERGEHQWAAPLFGAAEEQLKSFGAVWWPADRLEIERTRGRLRSALENDLDMLLEEGRGMSVEAAISYAATGI